jgi:hypothetical protein
MLCLQLTCTNSSADYAVPADDGTVGERGFEDLLVTRQRIGAIGCEALIIHSHRIQVESFA